MAKKPRGKPFEIGNAGGPGRPPMPAAIRELRKINTLKVQEIIGEFMSMTESEIKDIAIAPEEYFLERVVAGIALDALKNGDYFRLNFLFDRSIGKVTEKLEVKKPKPTVVRLNSGEAIVLGHTEDEE